jgi:hypothetical protein
VQVVDTPAVFSLGKDTLLCAGDNLTLTAPSGYAYHWQDGNSNSAISVTQAGTYWVDVSNQCGVKSDTINVTYSVCAGVENIFSGGGFRIYPNPSKGMFQIQTNSQQLLANSQIEIYNIMGEKVYSSSQLHQSTQLTINLSAQAAGIYFLQLKTEQGVATKKLVINK